MIKTGTVMKTEGKYATVLFARSSACGENCTGCGACEKKHHLSRVLNPKNAVCGDKVLVSLSDKTANSALFLIFILPVIVFVFAYCLIFSLLDNHIFATIISVGIIAIYAFIIKKNDKKIAPVPEITSILATRKDETNGT